MVQDQLIEYISSQLKIGVSRDTLKATLVGAGWQAADVEDTLKKVEGAGKPAAPATPASPMGIGVTTVAKPVQSIRVSDLVSASGSASTFSSFGMGGAKASSAKTAMPSSASGPVAKGGTISTGKPKSNITFMIVAIAVVVILAGLAAYLYYENTTLASKVDALTTTSGSVSTQLSSLNGQVSTLDASNTALTGQVGALTSINQVLLDNLSFVAVPSGPAATTSPMTVSVGGVLMSGKTSYSLLTPYGVTVYVANSKDPKVIAALAPFLKSTSSVTLTGTHIEGSASLTVTQVNGAGI